MSQEPATPEAFALRLAPRALMDADAAHSWFVETAGPEIADAWIDGFFEEITSLVTLPRRFPIASESDLLRANVRQMIYRRHGSRVAYKVLFTVNEPPEEAPFILIVHVRHGSRRPMTTREARAIRSEL